MKNWCPKNVLKLTSGDLCNVQNSILIMNSLYCNENTWIFNFLQIAQFYCSKLTSKTLGISCYLSFWDISKWKAFFKTSHQSTYLINPFLRSDNFHLNLCTLAYLNSIFYLYEKERYLFMKWQLKLKMVSNVIYGRAFDGGGM